jgi:tripartite-type tricarboxylate transporter receptor subunit TctC
MRFVSLFKVSSALFTALASFSASAQNFPSKPVHIIVPFAAGGLVESMARTLGSVFQESTGQPFIVETRPGGASIIGMNACAKAAPDGYTMCLTVADSLSYGPALYADLPYNPETDFAPVANLGWSNNLIVANAKTPYGNYKEMIAFAKSKPGAINWATWGPGSLPDLYLKWIMRTAGVNITGIPYKGAGAGNPAVLSGEADLTYMGFGVAAPQIKAGKIKPIVAIGPKRSSFMPSLPSLGEEGGDPGLQGYFGMFAPGKTPKPIVDRLNAELMKASKNQRLQDFHKTFTLDFDENTADQFAAFMKNDRATAAKVFRSIGVTPSAAPSN